MQLKERCRKGIPPSVRGRAWQYLSGSRELLLKNAGLFDVRKTYLLLVVTGVCIVYM